MQENETRKYTKKQQQTFKRKKQRKNGKQIHNLIYTENKTETCISDFYFFTSSLFRIYIYFLFYFNNNNNTNNKQQSKDCCHTEAVSQ